MSVVFGGGEFGPPPRRFYQAFERPRLDTVGLLPGEHGVMYRMRNTRE